MNPREPLVPPQTRPEPVAGRNRGGGRYAAVVFDYGNTLVELGPEQARHLDDALADAIDRLVGRVDRERLREIRAGNRIAPYRSGFRENDLGSITAALVQELTAGAPRRADVESLVALRHRSFVACVEAEPEVHAVLGRLRQRYRIGVLSNYPSGDSIRESLRETGIADFVDAVVVSADVGYVKPHPEPYRAVLEALHTEPGSTLMVGDNWLGDVQGAKRLGLGAAHFRRWPVAEPFEPQPGDLAPDWVVSSLTELETRLAEWDEPGGARPPT